MDDGWEQQEFDFDSEPEAPYQRYSIQQRFEEFHRKHPEVYQYLQQQIGELRRRGWRHFGIRCLWERARWYFQVDEDLGEEFKLNDHYHSRYVRLILENNPDLDGFFELRELKAE